ncbi:adenosylcobalamin-dependent ribonucleoside-diphosphate reductase [Thermus thermamylovorans]|uniref:Vitamin B12-dependent ribonucleotide reductase n=1 Tax=Thermus thermamylovorans TaxID=2509362 RepID=A0A4V2IV33_9DEIN|nr:adenosylcobalamin-dependent ribonucleoside-diphosphate reductase [Thermus thermamylovorans]TBH20695.1 adenosylcobalamin-dependent ribonucleoside-diphosphate reductase [Thermus thermamylovorans]
MPRRYTEEEALRLALEFFQGDELRASVFLNRYALKDPEGRLLEATPEEMWRRLAQGAARVEKGAKREFLWLFSDFRFVPGGRILFGLGNWRRSTLFNCYYIPIREDSVRGITRFLDEAARTFAYGGGVGTNADALRPKGAKVGNAGVESSGAVSFMELFSTLAGVMGASGGRRGALMLTFSDRHPDLLDFLRAKTDPERSRVRHANLSLRATDRFLEAAMADEPWTLSFTTPREHIARTLRAREAWDLLVEAAWASAEPGLLFWDRVKGWATAQYGGMEVEGVNVCGEVPMEPYGACNLGSLNLAAFVRAPFREEARLDFAGLEEAAALAVRFLDAVVDLGKNRHPLRAQREASLRSRRIGLGIMGLADALAMLGLPYGSEKSLRFAEEAMRRIKEAAYRESSRLAREQGPFPAFDPEAHLQSPFIQALPEDLVREVEKGLRNAALLSIAPTGSISILAGVTSGIEPIFALTYLRHAGGQAFLAEHPLLRRYQKERGGEVPPWPTAYSVDPFGRVRLQAALQRHVDQSISSTVNLPRETPKEVVERLFLTAWKEGCKGITVFREGSREEVLKPLPPVGVCTFCQTA